MGVPNCGANGIAYASINGTLSYYHKDSHSDVTALTDSTGTITKNYQFDAFGNELIANDNDTNPFRYCGEYYDAETGLIYLRNRYYDTATGRFISEDPHWNLSNMIYGENQEAVKYAIIDDEKVYFDINGNVVKTEKHTSLSRIDSNYSLQDDIIRSYEIRRTPDINAILQSSNLYVYAINNPIKYIDPSGESFAVKWGKSAWWLTGVDGPVPAGDAIYIGGIIVGVIVDGVIIYFAKKSKSSGKEKANDIPSWAKGEKPRPGESGSDFAKRLMEDKYGKGNYKTGPGSEYNKLKKYGDRGGK